MQRQKKVDGTLDNMNSRETVVAIDRVDDKEFRLWVSPYGAEDRTKKTVNLMEGARICAEGATVIAFSKL